MTEKERIDLNGWIAENLLDYHFYQNRWYDKFENEVYDQLPDFLTNPEKLILGSPLKNNELCARFDQDNMRWVASMDFWKTRGYHQKFNMAVALAIKAALSKKERENDAPRVL